MWLVHDCSQDWSSRIQLKLLLYLLHMSLWSSHSPLRACLALFNASNKSERFLPADPQTERSIRAAGCRKCRLCVPLGSKIKLPAELMIRTCWSSRSDLHSHCDQAETPESADCGQTCNRFDLFSLWCRFTHAHAPVLTTCLLDNSHTSLSTGITGPVITQMFCKCSRFVYINLLPVPLSVQSVCFLSALIICRTTCQNTY